jgi:hypothetical protein
MSNGSNVKITEDNLTLLPNEHILWLDIAMNEELLMSVLERLGHLLDVQKVVFIPTQGHSRDDDQLYRNAHEFY